MSKLKKFIIGILTIGVASAAPLAFDNPVAEFSARKIQVLGYACYEEQITGVITDLTQAEYDALGQPGGRSVLRAWCGLKFDTPRSLTQLGDYFDYNGETYYRLGQTSVVKKPQGVLPDDVVITDGKFQLNKSLKEIFTVNKAEAAITLDGSTYGLVDSALTLTFAKANTSGVNKLIVQVATWAAGGTTASVTYNGVSMTSARADANAGTANFSSVWYLDNPSTGSNNVVVTATSGTPFIRAAATSLYNARAGAADNSTGASFSGTSGGLTTNITTNVNDAWLFDAILDQSAAMRVPSPQVDNFDPSDTTSRGSYKINVGAAGSKSMIWLWSGSEDGVNTVVSFAPATLTTTSLLRLPYGGVTRIPYGGNVRVIPR